MRQSDIYQTLIDLNEDVVLGDIDRKIMAEELANHFKEEKKMLNKAKEIAKNVKDEYFKKLIERVVEDENRHHRLLQELLETIEKESTEWTYYFYGLMVDFP